MSQNAIIQHKCDEMFYTNGRKAEQHFVELFMEVLVCYFLLVKTTSDTDIGKYSKSVISQVVAQGCFGPDLRNPIKKILMS